MKLLIATDEGTILDEIEDVDEYDLTKPMARSVLLDEVAMMIDKWRDRQDEGR